MDNHEVRATDDANACDEPGVGSSSQHPEVVGPMNAAAPSRRSAGRRALLIRAGQVAAMTLFGTLGFDGVVERVLNRLGEVRGIDRMARALADEIRASTWAWAVEGCNGNYYHAVYVCVGPFTCPTLFDCTQFQCSEPVDCNRKFTCSSYDCNTPEPYQCPDVFKCTPRYFG